MTQSDAPTTPARPGLKPLAPLWVFLKPYRLIIAGTGVALMIAGSTFLIIPAILRYVIDRGLATRDTAVLNHSFILLFLAIIVFAGATYARYGLVSWLGERVVADMRRAVYAHILKLSPAFFEVTRSGDILSRLSSDASILQTLIGSSISVALRNCVLLTGGIVMMLTTSAKLTGLVLLVIPLVVVPIIIFGRKVKRLSKTSQERIADVSSTTEETIYGIRTVQAFSHEDLSRAQFNAGIEAAVQAAVHHIRTRGFLVALIIFLVLTSVSGVLWEGSRDLLAGKIATGQLMSFIIYSVITASATGAISEVGGDLNRAAGAAERIFDLLAVEPTVAAPAHPATLPAPRGELAFEGVTFNYPARPHVAALDNISFAVKPGEKVAIVGPSGAGKTTLFQLALRFYDPQMGAVLLDGVDIKTVDPRAVRARIALVPQDPVIFSANAWHNISYGKPEASREEILDAARAAHADEFLAALPEGYDTFLGEKGVRLSGGQKQRIVIARAILRNSPLLLLDEATSALDAESERLIQDALGLLMQQRTTLIIAHRLSTVMNADRILVMEEGRIVATGTHHELIAQGGLYARLASLQFDLKTT
ncbi:MAG: ABC transporter transmembrane domain-containing protein [Alphaproteobacteria bacterium]|nr:ABC transporter transmembrane domain-containing protein [Alphaproteobacteria bacterium]